MVFDEAGERLTPTHAVKKGTRYRYYVSTSLVTGAGQNRGGRRIPAGNLEGLVIERLRTFFADAGAILDTCDPESDIAMSSRLIERGRRIAEDLAAQGRDQIKALLQALLCRVDVTSDRIDISFSRPRLTEWLAESTDIEPRRGVPTNEPGEMLSLSVPVALKRVGREMRMMVETADDRAAPDPSLLRILARAHHVQARLVQNPTLTVHDVAREESVSAAHLYSILRLPWLAPDITTAIVNGRHPPQLTAKSLMGMLPRLPPDWGEQRKMLGFR